MVAYYFVAATLLAIIPVLVVFKITIEKLREHPEDRGQLLTRFFILVFGIEVLPIVLVILGSINQERVSDISDLYVPGLIIILAYIFAYIFITMQRINDTEVDTRMFRIIAFALASAIPIVSIVMLITMLP